MLGQAVGSVVGPGVGRDVREKFFKLFPLPEDRIFVETIDGDGVGGDHPISKDCGDARLSLSVTSEFVLRTTTSIPTRADIQKNAPKNAHKSTTRENRALNGHVLIEEESARCSCDLDFPNAARVFSTYMSEDISLNAVLIFSASLFQSLKKVVVLRYLPEYSRLSRIRATVPLSNRISK